MSDPIKDLESFNPQGLPSDPLPPSEVRRRGDRVRRRHNGVMALGAAAAVAVIATSGVFINDAVDQGREPAPAGPSQTVSPRPATIPDDFPLAAGVEGAEEYDSAELADLAYCDVTPLADLEPNDERSISLSGGETSITRTLYLLDSPEASVAAHAAILEAAAACTDGDPEDSGDVVVHRDGEGWPGSTVTEDFAHGESTTEPSVEVVNVVSAGSALLVTSNFGSWSSDINAGVAAGRSADNEVMVAMADFGAYDAPAAPSLPAKDDVLGPDGWKSLGMGMSAAELEATGLVTVADDDPAATCLPITIKGWADTVHPNSSGQVHGYVSKEDGLAILFAQPGARTPEGIGVGSTVEEVSAAYGELSGSDAFSTPEVDGKSWFFLTDGGKVTAFQLELAGQRCL